MNHPLSAPCRRVAALLAACAAGLLAVQAAAARYVRPTLETIPVQRLVENLQRLADKSPKDAQVRLNLARAHAMGHPLGVGTALSLAALLHLLRGDIQAVQTHAEATVTLAPGSKLPSELKSAGFSAVCARATTSPTASAPRKNPLPRKPNRRGAICIMPP